MIIIQIKTKSCFEAVFELVQNLMQIKSKQNEIFIKTIIKFHCQRVKNIKLIANSIFISTLPVLLCFGNDITVFTIGDNSLVMGI